MDDIFWIKLDFFGCNLRIKVSSTDFPPKICVWFVYFSVKIKNVFFAPQPQNFQCYQFLASKYNRVFFSRLLFFRIFSRNNSVILAPDKIKHFTINMRKYLQKILKFLGDYNLNNCSGLWKLSSLRHHRHIGPRFISNFTQYCLRPFPSHSQTMLFSLFRVHKQQKFQEILSNCDIFYSANSIFTILEHTSKASFKMFYIKKDNLIRNDTPKHMSIILRLQIFTKYWYCRHLSIL